MKNHNSNVLRDFGMVILSVLVSFILVKTGVLEDIFASTQELKFIGSFVAGMFFVSIFTAAPAIVVLAEVVKSNPILEVAFMGGVGALVGDLIIFRFVKDRVTRDFMYLVKKSKSERLKSIFRLKLFRWLMSFIGALIVASPFPDEIGLAMMGISKMKTSLFIPLSFLLNFSGIIFISLIVRAL